MRFLSRMTLGVHQREFARAALDEFDKFRFTGKEDREAQLRGPGAAPTRALVVLARIEALHKSEDMGSDLKEKLVNALAEELTASLDVRGLSFFLRPFPTSVLSIW